MALIPQNTLYYGRDLESMAYADNYLQWICEEFRPFIGRQIAEVGAGVGNFSKVLLEVNPEMLYLIEPSKNLHSLLTQRFRGYPNVLIFPEILGNISDDLHPPLDTILYINVLEHIENDRQELDCAYRVLRSGGKICLFVPALPCLYSEFDALLGHHRRYKMEQLERLVLDSGFTILKAKHFDMLGILPWFFTFVLLKQILTKEHAMMYDKFMVPWVRQFENLIQVPVGKNVLLVAKK